MDETDEIDQIERRDRSAHRIALESLRFPAEDDGRSLAEMAERDLEATLQLLTERALHVTGAAGAAIALRQGERMICRASAGASAPKVGIAVAMNSGLSGESIRTRKLLHCQDAAGDPRVDQEICCTMGIASAMVLPLLREDEVFGLFELLSARPNSFEERDLAALERLGEMIQTAVEHAEAAKRAHAGIGGADEPLQREPVAALPRSARNQETATPAAIPPAPKPVPSKIGRCTTCGFPVSEGRTLCVDCESSHHPDLKPTSNDAPLFSSGLEALSESRQSENWLRAHVYLIGAALVSLATLALILWFRR